MISGHYAKTPRNASILKVPWYQFHHKWQHTGRNEYANDFADFKHSLLP
jgi:hypothetical protein